MADLKNIAKLLLIGVLVVAYAMVQDILQGVATQTSNAFNVSNPVTPAAVNFASSIYTGSLPLVQGIIGVALILAVLDLAGFPVGGWIRGLISGIMGKRKRESEAGI